MRAAAKFTLSLGVLLGLGIFGLADGLAAREGWAVWIAGVCVGGFVASLYTIAWLRGVPWTRDVSRLQATLGRAFWPVAVSLMGLIFVGLRIGGDVSVFTSAASGALLLVSVLAIGLHAQRHWNDVRARLTK